MKKKTQIVSIDGMMITIPSYYVKVDSVPGDPDRSVPFMVRTENAECLAMIIPIDKKQSMPRKREDFISGIRQYLKENQGLIEVEAEDSFLFSIIKTLKNPTGAGVQYTLTFQKFMTEGILQVLAFFDETGTTGMRDSIVYAMLTNEGAIGTSDDPMHGWTRDPYDPKLRKGALMNLSEEERFDEMFPGSPLTMCRELVQCLIKEINPGDNNYLYVEGTLMFSADDFSPEECYSYEIPEGTYVPAGVYLVGEAEDNDIPPGTYTAFPGTVSGGDVKIYYEQDTYANDGSWHLGYDQHYDIRVTKGNSSESFMLEEGYVLLVEKDVVMRKGTGGTKLVFD